MTEQEFLDLSDEDQKTWLTEQTDSGRSVEDIVDELGITRADLQGYGYTYAMKSWFFMSMSDRSARVAQN